MSLDDEHWRALRLDPLDVQSAQEFLERYVDTLEEPPPDVGWLLDRRRLGVPDADGLIPYAGDDGGSPGGGGDPGGWRRAGAAADALRGAAAAALMTGATDEGIRLLLDAAALYLQMAVPYGCFLGTAAFPERGLGERALRLLEAASSGAPPAREDARFAEALRVPVQQAYLLLAIVGHPELRADWAGALARTRHLVGPAPLGTSARPLVDWWGFAQALAELADEPGEGRRWAVDWLADFAHGHGRQLGLAQLDRHHWRRLAAPVDLVDVDLAAATCFLARAVAALELEPLTLAEFGVDRLAQVSLVVGLQLALGGPEATSTPSRGPMGGAPFGSAPGPLLLPPTLRPAGAGAGAGAH